ncbi:hypothetical protein CVT25_012032 [Psilocybe cyanescens]|uniref:Uncharacterized protein n=1 Tax=Psilocybe cyanescens TaxID=93625 RepID=A0A409XUS1_PSICY|nr:hypothetical protein CVT25_012032 [Psilocybe cyanescens]
MAEGILQIRIYALYLQSRQILAVILTFFLISSSICAVIMGMVLEAIEAKALPIPSGKFCVPFNISTHYYTFWIPIICFEVLLCVLGLFRGAQISKSVRFGGGPSTFLRSGHRLVDILFRDSLIYFIAIGATYVTTMLFWLVIRQGLNQVPLGFTVAFPSVLSNRLLLNIRGASHHKQPNLDDLGEIELTNMNSTTGPSFNFRSYASRTSASQTMS